MTDNNIILTWIPHCSIELKKPIQSKLPFEISIIQYMKSHSQSIWGLILSAIVTHSHTLGHKVYSLFLTMKCPTFIIFYRFYFLFEEGAISIFNKFMRFNSLSMPADLPTYIFFFCHIWQNRIFFLECWRAFFILPLLTKIFLLNITDCLRSVLVTDQHLSNSYADRHQGNWFTLFTHSRILNWVYQYLLFSWFSGRITSWTG